MLQISRMHAELYTYFQSVSRLCEFPVYQDMPSGLRTLLHFVNSSVEFQNLGLAVENLQLSYIHAVYKFPLFNRIAYLETCISKTQKRVYCIVYIAGEHSLGH